MFDKGHGTPIVLIPGLHGRWEWTRPLLAQLAKQNRAISYSLCGDLGSGWRLDPALGFENYTRQLEDVLDRAGVARAVICGISYGGLIALRYAAARPERVAGLVLASTPGPGWHPTAQQARWIARPWLSAPVFVATSPVRVWPEISQAIPGWRGRLEFMCRQGLRAAAAPMIPSLMSSRIRWTRGMDLAGECARVTAPTLVLTGEEGLDRVVPVSSTRGYTRAIRGARYEMIDGTGHIGVLTQPERFAAVLSDFANGSSH
jgi:pimeloyl-ACP methyl ester carboxylesterase